MFRRKPKEEPDYTLFFSSDVHGSEKCWMKFVNAARVYGAQALVMGGDLTGKAIVPIIRQGNGRYEMDFMGSRSRLTEDELPEAEKRIRFNGMYPHICDPEELTRMEEDPAFVAEIFKESMTEQLRRWLAIARERLEPQGVQCFIMPGNDDEFYLDDVIDEESGAINPDMRIVEVGPYQMLSTSWVPPTPWDSPRECTEEELLARLHTVAEGLDPDKQSIFNLHSPPYQTGLDDAAELKPDLSPVTIGGQMKMIPVGSHAVRTLIEECQPLVALHGHIHEARGTAKIGRTICVNPGSTYGEGTLDGCVVKLRGDKVLEARITRG